MVFSHICSWSFSSCTRNDTFTRKIFAFVEVLFIFNMPISVIETPFTSVDRAPQNDHWGLLNLQSKYHRYQVVGMWLNILIFCYHSIWNIFGSSSTKIHSIILNIKITLFLDTVFLCIALVDFDIFKGTEIILRHYRIRKILPTVSNRFKK